MIESIFKHEPRDNKFIEFFSPDADDEIEVYVEHDYEGISFFLSSEEAGDLCAALVAALNA